MIDTDLPLENPEESHFGHQKPMSVSSSRCSKRTCRQFLVTQHRIESFWRFGYQLHPSSALNQRRYNDAAGDITHRIPAPSPSLHRFCCDSRVSFPHRRLENSAMHTYRSSAIVIFDSDTLRRGARYELEPKQSPRSEEDARRVTGCRDSLVSPTTDHL